MHMCVCEIKSYRCTHVVNVFPLRFTQGPCNRECLRVIKRATNNTRFKVNCANPIETPLSLTVTMAHNSICSMLNEERVIVQQRRRGSTIHLVTDERSDNDVVTSGATGYRGQWNNLALGNLNFKHVSSDLIPPTTKHRPQVGDVCVRLMAVVARSEAYSSIVDLYNTYIVTGSSQMATRCINSYTGTRELHIPAIPLPTFVDEWNKSLRQFHDMIGQDDPNDRRTAKQRRMIVLSNVTELALKKVPIVTDHLWFVLHSIVSRPCLVKQVLQLVGAISSTTGLECQTGTVENVTIPRYVDMLAVKLYLIAKAVPARGNSSTILRDEAGVTLALMWAATEDELHENLRNSGSCSYVHVGTESGNTFRCNGFCEWRYYNHTVFERMARIGHETVSKYDSSGLAGDTGDSARVVHQA